MLRVRISRAEYETLKAACAARIKLRMEQLNLTPSEVYKRSSEARLKNEQLVFISMQELSLWRAAKQLPKDHKLIALAAVLQDSPDSFLPKEHQQGRSLVARHKKVALDSKNGDYRCEVTPSQAQPGCAYVDARILLPTDKAYALARALETMNTKETMRRTGKSEEEIKQLLEQPQPERTV